MAIKTRQQLRDYWNTWINTNGSQAITGAIQNVGGIDIIDSMTMGTSTIPKIYTGHGNVGEVGNVSWVKVIAVGGTWEIVYISTPQEGPMKNFSYAPLSDEFLVDFPVPVGTPVDITFTMVASVDLNSTPIRTLEFTHAINGVTNPDSVWQHAYMAQELTRATDFYPISYTWSGAIPNGDGIAMLMKSNNTGNIHGRGMYYTITGTVVES